MEISIANRAVEKLGESWAKVIGREFHEPYMLELATKLSNERKTKVIYPSQENVFRAFKETPYDRVKAVILGQDPYHDGNATGLSFDCGLKVTPSMRRIIEGFEQQFPSHFSTRVMEGNLQHWAAEGVLLLNVALTVRRKEPGSHMQHWKPFTESVINALNDAPTPPIYLLWGGFAHKYKEIISDRCHIIESEHPVAGVYAGRTSWEHNDCFLKANAILDMQGISKIQWE